MLISTEIDAKAPDLLAVIADPIRWQILRLLTVEELCSTHLQEELGAKQTLISHHMRVLREAGLVETSPCGRFTYYRLRPGALREVAQSLSALHEASGQTPARRPC